MLPFLKGAMRLAPTKPLLRHVLTTKLELVQQEQRPMIAQQIQHAIELLDDAATLDDFLQTAAHAKL